MKKVYLTVDDGPSKDFREKVDFLYSSNIPAIFFCLGSLMEKRAKDVVYAINKGFVIGNHSYDHPKFSEISTGEAKKQIQRTDRIIEKLYQKAGVKRLTKTFRFPHGDKGNEETKEIYQSVLREFGYKQPNFKQIKLYGNPDFMKDIDVCWTYNSKDYTVTRYRLLGMKSPYGYSSQKLVLDRIDENDHKHGKGLNYSRTRDIILVHDSEIISDLFYGLVNKLISKKTQFELPA